MTSVVITVVPGSNTAHFKGYITSSGVPVSNPSPLFEGPTGSIIGGAPVNGATFNAGVVDSAGNAALYIVMAGTQPQDLFDSVIVTSDISPKTFATLAATFTQSGGFTQWAWSATGLSFGTFTQNTHYPWTFSWQAPAGFGDIPDPDAWEDANDKIPPAAFNNVPPNTNYPQNGDGRYWFAVNAHSPLGVIQNFIGDPDYFTGTASFQYSINQVANDSSNLFIAYSTDGVTYTDVQIGPNRQHHGGLISGRVDIDLTGATGLFLQVFTTGGTSSPTATAWQVAVAITRNSNEGIHWDNPDPFDPINYNGEVGDTIVPTATLAQLRARIITRLNFKTLLNEVPGMTLEALQTYLMQRLGFAAQAASPPPGMADMLTAIINESQQGLYRRYAQDGYNDAAPTLLVNPTDALTLDNFAVQVNAVAIAKAHYGQPDARMFANQYETYLKELMQRSPPTLKLIVNDALTSAQTWLYKEYTALHTRRFFRWKVNPGQRFYSMKDNDENVLADFNLDPTKTIEWVGIQDSRNVWYPLIEGIPPQLYTMITKPWRPARYTIRAAIELYPAPDQTYWLWVRGHFGLQSFVNDSDNTTIDSELVFLHALALCKKHYNQPDADTIEAQSERYRARLIAGTHATAHYVPGTVAVPPAVRPTLVQFQDNQGG